MGGVGKVSTAQTLNVSLNIGICHLWIQIRIHLCLLVSEDQGSIRIRQIFEFLNKHLAGSTKEHMIAVEGMYTGQYVYCGKDANLHIGNILPLKSMPEGTVVSNIEEKVGDKGRIARATGTCGILIGFSQEGAKAKIKLPSGVRKVLDSNCRATVGLVAGGGRTDKPILKAGNQ